MRPTDDFRGYAGQIASGTVRVGDRDHRLAIGPDDRASRASSTWDGDLDIAVAPMSVTLVLADDDRHQPRRRAGARPDRGRPPVLGRTWCGWTSGRSIRARPYLLKHASRVVTAELDRSLRLNEIGPVTVTAARQLVFDSYADNRTTGQLRRHRSGDELHGRRRDDRAPRAGDGAASRDGAPAARLAQAARAAANEADAAEAVRRVLEEMLT